MRTLLLVVAVVVALFVAVGIGGYLLPVQHTAIVSATIPASPESVWHAITTPAEYPAWRGDVATVEVLPPSAGHAAWRETGKNGAITFVVDSAEPPRRFVTRITDKSLPFGGTWEYVIVPNGSGSLVRITERGEVYNPAFRIVSRFVMGHTATATAYLEALGRRFGAEVVPMSA